MLTLEGALIIALIVIIVVGVYIHLSYRNDIIELRNLLADVPAQIQTYNNGLKDSVKSSVKRQKPALPEDLDEFSDILIKMLKRDWVASYDYNSAMHYYHIATLAGIQGYHAEWYQDPNTHICYVRLTQGR